MQIFFVIIIDFNRAAAINVKKAVVIFCRKVYNVIVDGGGAARGITEKEGSDTYAR